MVQQFRVKPNEFAKERPYIARNIRATRDAYELVEDRAAQPFDYDRRPHARGRQRQPDHDRQRAPLGSRRHRGDVRPDRGVPDLLQRRRRRHRPLHDQQRDRSRPRSRCARSTAARCPSQSWINEHIIYTHGYGVIASPTNVAVEHAAGVLREQHPGRRPAASRSTRAARRSTSASSRAAYVIVDAKQPSFNYPRQGVRDSLTPLPRAGRREAVERAAQGGVRAALQRHQPADLRADPAGVEDPAVPVDPQPGREARAVPEVTTTTRTPL